MLAALRWTSASSNSQLAEKKTHRVHHVQLDAERGDVLPDLLWDRDGVRARPEDENF